ncbi:MAG: hypothetical protein ACREOI_09650 [bacterium]
MANSVLSATTNKVNHNAKAIVRGVLDELPEDCTLEDIMLELYVRASILESREQIIAGKGISLEEAREELGLWFTSQSLPNSSPN